MIRRLPLFLLLLLAACGRRILPSTAPVPLPAGADIETTLFLIGDAGAPDSAGEPVLQALRDQLAPAPERSVVAFLGDNIYPRGLPAPDAPGFAEAARRLDAQIAVVVESGARGIFIPGNHDWDRWGPDGWNAIRRQGDRIARLGQGRVSLVPSGGCPGPEVMEEGRWLRLVVIDTQWWLHDNGRPEAAGSGCATFQESAMGDALGLAVRGAGERHVVVLGHHPLESGGEHGGFFEWKDHLFPLRPLKSWLWLPLPVLGSIYPVARSAGIHRQDIPNGNYQRMRRAFERSFKARPPLVYAAGHEHALQVIRGGPARWQLVSGSGIYGHHGPVTGIRGTLLALSESGFMRVDVARDGTVRLGVITVDRHGRGTEVYSRWLTAQPGEQAHADRAIDRPPPHHRPAGPAAGPGGR